MEGAGAAGLQWRELRHTVERIRFGNFVGKERRKEKNRGNEERKKRKFWGKRGKWFLEKRGKRKIFRVGNS